jgi:iron complex outermembrane receptor protein
MVKRWIPLLAALSASSCLAKELSESDFLREMPVVLTPSRLAQPIQDAPNAITVIDRAMIEASGFMKISDLFRLVPGFYVGQSNGYTASISNSISSEYARHMQVLVDGRSIYLPSTGGVRWDSLPLAIDDIERIEVVRGPNAASYGANAMTGVINIISRHPTEVEGKSLSLTTGADQYREAHFRWAGGDINKHRVSIGWLQDTGFFDPTNNINDTTRAPMFNYFGDYDIGPGQSLSAQLGYVGGTRGAGSATNNNGLTMPHDERVDSQFQQLDYRRSLANGQEVLVKAYHTRQVGLETIPVVNPLVPAGYTYERTLTSERWHGEAQWNYSASDTLRTNLGIYDRRDIVNSEAYYHTSDDLATWSRGVFGHAEWRMSPQWLVNAGAMWEQNTLGGGHVSPLLALNWQPSSHHTVRIGASRAYRNPVEVEANGNFQLTVPLNGGGTTTIVRLAPNPAIQPESNLSREIGYLGNWPEYGINLDLRIYHEHLSNLIDIRTGTKYMDNVADSTHNGMDGQLRWHYAPHSFVVLSYAQLHIDTTHVTPQYFPRHVSSLLVSQRLPYQVDVSLGHYRSDGFVSYEKNLPPDYRRTDLRIAKEFKLRGNMAKIAYVLQHADGADYEFDNTLIKRLSRRGYLQFQMDF